MIRTDLLVVITRCWCTPVVAANVSIAQCYQWVFIDHHSGYKNITFALLLSFLFVNQHENDENSDAPVTSEQAQSDTHDDDGDSSKEKRPLPWYIDIPAVIVITMLVVAVVQTFIARPYVIPSQSMEPTLHGCSGCVGDKIMVEKITYRFSDPRPGDVIVFKGTDSWNESFQSQRSTNPVLRTIQNAGAKIGLVAPDENILVKRVIATGGQTIQCLAGDPGIMVDGHRVDDSFILEPPQYPINTETGSVACGGDYFGPVTVPDNNLFMMGDNRTNSSDSRYHLGDEYQGTIPIDNVRGKVKFIFLPLSRISFVDDPIIQQ